MSVRAKVLPAPDTSLSDARTTLLDLKELLKPGISLFVVVVAAASYLVGLGATPIDMSTLVALLVGVFLTAGGSGALNHLIERKHDAQMRRTRDRPLPGERLGLGFVAAYGTALDLVDGDQNRYWFMHYTRAICYHQVDDWPPAEADFRRALELNPGQPQVLNFLGYSLVEQRRNLDEALGMIEQAVASRPDSGYIVDSLAWVY